MKDNVQIVRCSSVDRINFRINTVFGLVKSWRRLAILHRLRRPVVEVEQTGRLGFATKDWSIIDDGRPRLRFQANAG
ncbi:MULTISPECIES: hypothetical protein [Burkholderia cepacia complex]|uniref:hypothetical protein n=1 Tax=Burkholderia cepacia complex TaxID=87882 RepID=UPI0011476490|nr:MULTISPECIES: hypothetical protein [Burkholderia cepacia complex]